MSVEEYLALEQKSKLRHEYMDGEIFSMAGATRKHNLATTNISTELNLQLRKTDCEVYASDFRVKLRENHNVYPDVAVACGEISRKITTRLCSTRLLFLKCCRNPPNSATEAKKPKPIINRIRSKITF